MWLGEGDGLADLDGLGEADGDDAADGDVEPLGLAVGVDPADGEVEPLGLAVALADELGLFVALPDGLAAGDEEPMQIGGVRQVCWRMLFATAPLPNARTMGLRVASITVHVTSAKRACFLALLRPSASRGI